MMEVEPLAGDANQAECVDTDKHFTMNIAGLSLSLSQKKKINPKQASDLLGSVFACVAFGGTDGFVLFCSQW